MLRTVSPELCRAVSFTENWMGKDYSERGEQNQEKYLKKKVEQRGRRQKGGRQECEQGVSHRTFSARQPKPFDVVQSIIRY